MFELGQNVNHNVLSKYLQWTLIKFIFPAVFEPFISITEKTGTLFFNQEINEKYEGEIQVYITNHQ